MDENFTVTDFDDRPITIGTRVRLWDYSPIPFCWSDHAHMKHNGSSAPGYTYGPHPHYGTGKASSYYGVVVDVTDWDGDCDDEGRSIAIEPDVVVRFDDGHEESFRTSEWEISYGWWDRATGDGDHDTGAGKVEELVVVTEKMFPGVA